MLKAVPRIRESATARPSIVPNHVAQSQYSTYRQGLVVYQNQIAEWNSKSKSKGKSSKKPEPPKKPKFHEPAQILLENIAEELLDFDSNVKDGEGFLIKSGLALKARDIPNADGGRTMLPVHNETSPRDYLCLVIEDVIRSSGLSGLTVVREATLFSLRPDLVVVLIEGRLLLAVENPW